MRFAYADPPYPGQAKRLYGAEAVADGREAREVNHALLVRYLCDEFPDGWALSTSTPALRDVLNLSPDDVRVCAWVKGWCSWKPNTHPFYAWEPVLLRGGRKPTSDAWRTRDWIMCNVATTQTQHEEFVRGAKPAAFIHWIFAILGLSPDDDLVDLFPGSAAVTRAWERWRNDLRLDFGSAARAGTETEEHE